MDFHSKLHHDIPGIFIYLKQLTNTGPETIRWDMIRASARKAARDLMNVFAAYANEKYGWDTVGAAQFIQSIESHELEIDADRIEFLTRGGNAEIYDASRKQGDAEEQRLFDAMPEDLLAMVKVKKNVDEIIQIARKNLGQKPHRDYGSPVISGR